MKRWIKGWLGITKLERSNAILRKRISNLRDHVQEANRLADKRVAKAESTTKFMEAKANASAETAKAAQVRVEQLADLFTVGLDYSPTGYDRSWVVICIRGKLERVQFMDVSDKEAKEIKNFLSIFNRDNVRVDAGPTMSRWFKSEN